MIPRPALMVSLFVALTACTSDHSSPAPDHTPVLPSPKAINATGAPLLPTDRYELPSFDYPKLQRLLGELKGTPVVLNIWGSWCGPCHAEAPNLARAALRYGKRVQFLGLDIQETGGREAAQLFIRDAGWPYPSVFDPTYPSAVRNALGFLGQPDTIFYDRSGRRVKVLSGPSSFQDIQTGVRRILS